MHNGVKSPPTFVALAAAKDAELFLRCGFTGAVGAGAPHNIDVATKEAVRQRSDPGPRTVACTHDNVTNGGPFNDD
jgi:hypothetical protein